MAAPNSPKFRIYPSIGIARLGNGPAQKDQVVFSPEVPWANLFETENNYLTEDGALKKQAQRFYIYACDDDGVPIGKIDPSEYDIEWTAEVANKKPFWYDFNNSLDLSVQLENHQDLSPNFYDLEIAPGISTQYRNPNVLNEGLRREGGENYRQELVNSPDAVSVSASVSRRPIIGSFPFLRQGRKFSLLARELDTEHKPVKLATLEYDDGALIFYPADGKSASLNPSDLNTDFADNSNWYDDICDGRITAKIKNKSTGETYELTDAQSAAWVASAPPDYAPQIQPLSTMYDLIVGAGAGEDDTDLFPELSLVFPLMWRLYRMQWVNQGDFLAPSFRETIDKLTAEGKFNDIFDHTDEAAEVREYIFDLFRNPYYDYNNEPVIPSKNTTDLTQVESGTAPLLLPFYPGDGIDYPGSPAQWFAIPPFMYKELERWKNGEFFTPPEFKFKDINEMGAFYRERMMAGAQDPEKAPLMMTRAVLETLYGGGFHPGVELTWPMRHKQMYKELDEIFDSVSDFGDYSYGFYGLWEVRLNAATPEEQEEIFYNDFGFRMDSQDIQQSLDPMHEKHWLWKATPGDLTKWMGIPWQSDAGSCQAVWLDIQYPVPAWWAANLPVTVLTAESLDQIQDKEILEDTRRYIYASRLPWLHTADTGYVGYHAEGGYQNGLIAMVYEWKNVGVVTGRKSEVDIPGIPEIVYVAYEGDK